MATPDISGIQDEQGGRSDHGGEPAGTRLKRPARWSARHAIVATLAASGTVVLAKAAADVQAANYVAGVAGALFAARLMQHTVLMAVRESRGAHDLWVAVLACLWMPAVALTNSTAALHWCVPAGVLLTQLAPAWTVWSATVLNVATVSAVGAFEFGLIQSATSAVVLAVTGFSCAYFRNYLQSAQEQIAEQLKRLELALRCSGAGTFEWSAETGTMWYSDRFKEIVGYSVDEDLPTEDYFRLVHPDDRSEIRRSTGLQIKEAQGKDFVQMRPYEYRLLTRDGMSVWIHAEAVILGNQGEVKRLVCTVLDITATVRTQDALSAAHRRIQEQAALLGEQRTALTSALGTRDDLEELVRHDLRGRLSTIATTMRRWAHALGPREAANEQALTAMGEVDQTILSIDRVGELLDFRAMEEGTYAFSPVDVDLQLTAMEVQAALRSTALGTGIDVQLVNAERFGCASADDRLCQVALEILMRQAIVLSAPGTRVTVEPYSGTRVGLVVHTPADLDPSRVDELMKSLPAAQWSSSRWLTTYFARLVARSMGGDLSVFAAPGLGTRFTLKLRRGTRQTDTALDSEQAMDAMLPPAMTHDRAETRLSLLLVGDPGENWQRLQRWAGSSTVLRKAERSSQAIDALVQERPDLILFNPASDRDASAAARQIREMQTAACEQPTTLVALVPVGTAVDQQSEATFDHILSAPLEQAELSKLTRALAAERAALSTTPWVEAGIVSAFPDYIASRRRLISELDKALKARDYRSAATIAHTIAGSPGLHGFEAGIAICKAVEALHSSDDRTEKLSLLLRDVRQLEAMFESPLVR